MYTLLGRKISWVFIQHILSAQTHIIHSYLGFVSSQKNNFFHKFLLFRICPGVFFERSQTRFVGRQISPVTHARRRARAYTRTHAQDSLVLLVLQQQNELQSSETNSEKSALNEQRTFRLRVRAASFATSTAAPPTGGRTGSW